MIMRIDCLLPASTGVPPSGSHVIGLSCCSLILFQIESKFNCSMIGKPLQGNDFPRSCKHRRFDIKRHTCREIPAPNAAYRRNQEGGDTIIERQYEICLRLNREEATLLQTKAKEYGATKNAYLRMLLKSVVPLKHPNEEIDRLRTEVHAIGNNINQLARKFNAGYGTKEDAEQVEFLMEQVYECMYEIAKE